MAHISFSAQPPARRLTISKLFNPWEPGFSLLYRGEVTPSCRPRMAVERPKVDKGCENTM